MAEVTMEEQAPDLTLYCVNCGGEMSAERLDSRSVRTTCSVECAKASTTKRDKLRKKRPTACGRCHRPSTPQEWANFRRWRASEQAKTADSADICPTCLRKPPGKKKKAAVEAEGTPDKIAVAQTDRFV